MRMMRIDMGEGIEREKEEERETEKSRSRRIGFGVCAEGRVVL